LNKDGVDLYQGNAISLMGPGGGNDTRETFLTRLPSGAFSAMLGRVAYGEGYDA
jgi:hypothetical protein